MQKSVANCEIFGKIENWEKINRMKEMLEVK